MSMVTRRLARRLRLRNNVPLLQSYGVNADSNGSIILQQEVADSRFVFVFRFMMIESQYGSGMLPDDERKPEMR